jgi:uncharacterized cupredoxin-like copper-binding protein
VRLRALAPVLFLVVLSSCMAGARASERRVFITIEHSHFNPSDLTVERGTTVTFVIRNGDPIDHEIIVGDRTVQHHHEVGRQRHHHGEVPGEVSVPAGTHRTTTYTFSQTGTMLFGCHLPGHYDYGMRGVIHVD